MSYFPDLVADGRKASEDNRGALRRSFSPPRGRCGLAIIPGGDRGGYQQRRFHVAQSVGAYILR